MIWQGGIGGRGDGVAEACLLLERPMGCWSTTTDESSGRQASNAFRFSFHVQGTVTYSSPQQVDEIFACHLALRTERDKAGDWLKTCVPQSTGGVLTLTAFS